MPESEILDQIEAPDGCTLVWWVGEIGCEEQHSEGHACKRLYRSRVARAAFFQEKSWARVSPLAESSE